METERAVNVSGAGIAVGGDKRRAAARKRG